MIIFLIWITIGLVFAHTSYTTSEQDWFDLFKEEYPNKFGLRLVNIIACLILGPFSIVWAAVIYAFCNSSRSICFFKRKRK